MDALKKEGVARWITLALSGAAIIFTVLVISFNHSWIAYWMLSLSISIQLIIQGINSYTRMLLRSEVRSNSENPRT